MCKNETESIEDLNNVEEATEILDIVNTITYTFKTISQFFKDLKSKEKITKDMVSKDMMPKLEEMYRILKQNDRKEIVNDCLKELLSTLSDNKKKFILDNFFPQSLEIMNEGNKTGFTINAMTEIIEHFKFITGEKEGTLNQI